MSGRYNHPEPNQLDRLVRALAEADVDRMLDRAATIARLREAQSRLACAEPARRLDACSCWQGYEAAIRIVEEGL